MGCDLKSFCAYCDELLQPSLFQDMAVNGLQVEGKREIKRICTAVSASVHVIEQAVKMQADLLLTHHGLFLKGRDAVVRRALRDKLKLLLQNDMSLVSYHLPLDGHELFGNNWPAARALGWTNLESFSGVGVKGRVPSMPRADFQKTLEKLYGQKAQVVEGGKEIISRVALISGGAYKWIDAAVDAGVDCFVTGNVDEPAWHMAKEGKINFYALGHAATEKIGVQLLGEHLSERFGVEHVFVDEENPF